MDTPRLGRSVPVADRTLGGPLGEGGGRSVYKTDGLDLFSYRVLSRVGSVLVKAPSYPCMLDFAAL